MPHGMIPWLYVAQSGNSETPSSINSAFGERVNPAGIVFSSEFTSIPLDDRIAAEATLTGKDVGALGQVPFRIDHDVVKPTFRAPRPDEFGIRRILTSQISIPRGPESSLTA